MFDNILAADHKYYLLNRGNFRQPMQMQLSQKQKLFSKSVSAFFKSILKFEYLQTEVDPDS